MKDNFRIILVFAGIPTPLTDGPLLLATIISQAYTNTRSISAIYRTNLTRLEAKMQETPGADIVAFNAYVQEQINLLAAGGRVCDDLPYYLLRAYKNTNDDRFLTYIESKENEWKDGAITWNRNGSDLMSLADRFYRDAKAQNIWQKVVTIQDHRPGGPAQIGNDDQRSQESSTQKGGKGQQGG
mmetsp:Transcript_8113/g.11819  ORF Transcript_8113/g.11819 Transcript_8113/m.11819 type:complete len:184 (+) Transcript_8113:1971-2522(+)